jgi:hypothetical protein
VALSLVPAFLIQDEHNISLKLSSSSVPSFREKYSSRENKHFKFLPVCICPIHVDWYGINITCFQKFLLKCLGLAEN